MLERTITDISVSNLDFAFSLFRYLNQTDAHEGGLTFEVYNDVPNNLMHFVTKVAKGKLEKLSGFEYDYDTFYETGARHLTMR